MSLSFFPKQPNSDNDPANSARVQHDFPGKDSEETIKGAFAGKRTRPECSKREFVRKYIRQMKAWHFYWIYFSDYRERNKYII